MSKIELSKIKPLDVWAIIFGKLFHGVFVTVVHMSVMKHLNETVPLKMIGRTGVFFQLIG